MHPGKGHEQLEVSQVLSLWFGDCLLGMGKQELPNSLYILGLAYSESLDIYFILCALLMGRQKVRLSPGFMSGHLPDDSVWSLLILHFTFIILLCLLILNFSELSRPPYHFPFNSYENGGFSWGGGRDTE